MVVLDRLLVRFSRNYALLRRAVDSAGRALAKRPYDSFLQPGEELSFSELVDDVEVHFGVEIFREDNGGVLWVYVNAQTDLPTPLLIKPSFVFRKLPDGRAYVVT
jgi:hypothetical protein